MVSMEPTGIEYFIQHYGYIVVLVGAMFEGETILIVAGLAARMGHLQLPYVVLVAFIGALIGDQFFFLLGRFRSEMIRSRFSAWESKIARVHKLLDRHLNLVTLLFRFFYGFRIITPFAIGMFGFSAKRFIALNIIGAAIWATLISAAAYEAGAILEHILGEIRSVEQIIFAIIVGAGLIMCVCQFIRRRKGV